MQTIIDSCLFILFDVSVRSLLLAVSAVAVLFLLRIRNRNVHHRVLSVVLLAMLTIPILQWFLPAFPLQIPLQNYWQASPEIVEASSPETAAQNSLAAASEAKKNTSITSSASVEIASQPFEQRRISRESLKSVSGQEIESARSSWEMFFYLYLTGLVFGLVRLGVGIWKVNRLVKSGKTIYPTEALQTPVLQSSSVRIPLTVGVFHPVILLPNGWRTWHTEMLQSVLEHEQTHIDRRDYLVGLLTELNRCLYWFHPLAWWLRKKLATLAEQVCDDLVIAKLENRTSYAEHLLKIASCMKMGQPGNIALGVPMARTSQLESRINAILDATRPQAKKLGLRSSCILLLVTLPLTSFLVAVQAAENTETPDKKIAAGEKAKSDDSTADEAPKFEMSKTIRVVNADGAPIVGATVTPWAIRSPQGHGFWTTTGKGQSEPPILTTDEQGAAIIPFPRYSNSQEKIRPQALTCRVEHSEYADSAYNDVSVTEDQLENTTTIKMFTGALVEVEARHDGEKLSGENLYALWSDYSSKKLEVDDSGRITLPRISAGTKLIRLVRLSEDGATLFSDIQQVSLINGEELQLQFAMKPGITVRGQIDESVTRPVTNGKVIGKVIDLASDGVNVSSEPIGFNRPPTLEWQVNTIINADGTFILNDVPPGNLQVIALCDGFRASSEESPPDFINQQEAQYHAEGPQVFSVDKEHREIGLKMIPTATCNIKVVGPDQKPVENAQCSFWPNVFWWHGGSQVYCHPLFATAEGIRNPERIKELLAKQKEVPYSAKTDANGIAVINGLPAGTNRFIVTHEQYELPLNSKAEMPGANRYRSVELVQGKSADVSVTMQPKGLEFLGEQVTVEEPQIQASGRRTHIPKPRPLKIFKTQASDTELSGVVVDELGLPLAEVQVDAWSWYPGNETSTDDEGRFRLKNFDRKEDVEVLFSKDKYSPSYFVSQKAGTDNWTIVLTEGTWLEGKVLDPSGEPVPNATVKAMRGPFENPNGIIGDVTTKTQTNEVGNYRIYLEPDTYIVQAFVSGMGAIRYDDIKVSPKERKKLDIKLEPGVTFQAVVLNSITQEPVEGFMLWSWRQPEIEGVSDENGLLEISGMMEGEFEFNVSAVGVDRRRSSVAGDYARWWSPESANEFGLERIPEGERLQDNWDDLKFDLHGENYRVKIFVEPLVTIQGRVLDPDGNPVQGATVAPAKTGSGNSITGDTRFSYETDTEGRFSMKLPASKNAKYNLVAHDGKYQQWRDWANGVGEPIQTSPGQVIEDVELRLTRPATVRGKVTNAHGTPRAHVKVRATAFDRLDNRYYNPETETDAEGNYELKFIRPGKHYIQIAAFSGQAETPTTRIVELAPNVVKDGVDFPPAGQGKESRASKANGVKSWRRGQIVDFRVVNAETGKPIPGVSLELQNMGPGIDFQDIEVQTTDEKGKSEIKLPDTAPTAVRVYPSKPGFVPLRVYWEGEPNPSLPKSITIPMEPGKVFGGTVQNEAGEPIAGVDVSIQYWGPGKGKSPHIRANICPENYTCKGQATTDENGRWKVNVMPSDVDEDEFRIYVSHPDYISDHLKRGFIPQPVTKMPAIDKFFDQTAVMVMRSGKEIRGHVVNTNGDPIPNASINDSDQYWWQDKNPRATTDEEGLFRIGNFDSTTPERIWGNRSGQILLAVQAPGYSPELVSVPKSDDPIRVTLKPGHTVRGRIFDESGKPLEGVSITERRWREQKSRLGLGTKSKADGSFEITDVPADIIVYDFSKDGYMHVEDFEMTPSSNEYSITMKASVVISGSVVDAETGKPLDQFTLFRGIDYEDGRAPSWMKYDKKTITNGRYDTTLVQEGYAYRLRVEAEGYMPAESRIFKAYESDQGNVAYDFKLAKEAPLTGTVLGLEDEPIADAEVFLARSRINIDNRKVTYADQMDRPAKITGRSGRFEFPPEVEPFCLVVIHEKGIGMVTEKQFEKSQQIQIQPWTAKNQQLQIIRRPAPKQLVHFPVQYP